MGRWWSGDVNKIWSELAEQLHMARIPFAYAETFCGGLRSGGGQIADSDDLDRIQARHRRQVLARDCAASYDCASQLFHFVSHPPGTVGAHPASPPSTRSRNHCEGRGCGGADRSPALVGSPHCTAGHQAAPLLRPETQTTSSRKSRYCSEMCCHENSATRFCRSTCMSGGAREAISICEAIAAGPSSLSRNSPLPTIQRRRGESHATIGRPQAIASRKTFPNDSSLAR